MRYPKIRSSVIGFLFCGFFLVTAMPALADNGIYTLTEYFDLLISDNLESARDLWSEDALERSSRFGIEYVGVPLKVDCSSPIVRDIPLMRDHLQPPVKSVKELPGGDFVKLKYSAIVQNELIEYYYYLFFDGDYFWLCYPQDYFCQDWPVHESRYFRINTDPEVEKYLHQMVLDAADSFVERIADSLGLTESDLRILAEKKIEY
ncbi:MAG: hypothetical protein U9R56_02690, partial [candidate division Zixibacteria bacterium]|nr:hypothetical protein [candidate division Zixibacteria bacterium]